MSSALAAINAETIRAFDWLTNNIDRRAPVTFVPNPGNIGDAAINLACFDYLTERFDEVEICAMAGIPRTECVFVGGGGNAVEPLYFNVSDFLDALAPEHRLFMFPATVRGHEKSLQGVARFARILCREPVSLAYVAEQIGPENVSLAHDAAFLLAPRLRADFASQISNAMSGKCHSFRTDDESIHPSTAAMTSCSSIVAPVPIWRSTMNSSGLLHATYWALAQLKRTGCTVRSWPRYLDAGLCCGPIRTTRTPRYSSTACRVFRTRYSCQPARQ